MGTLVKPSVYFVGATTVDGNEIARYLQETGQSEFLQDFEHAITVDKLHPGEALCSMFAKMCYKSLVLGKNENISKTRDIKSNLAGCFDHGHGSVFEHVQLNFIIANCSRVFTHELVRHRVGTAFSQTSGRYVKGSEVDIVWDPILDPVLGRAGKLVKHIEEEYAAMCEELGLNKEGLDFAKKKQMTSALRRFLPNGQSNEIAFSCNLRMIRHLVMLRTSRFAEWEIRLVFEQIYSQVKDHFPMLFYGATEEVVEGILEISGMKMQPYEHAEEK